MNRETSQKTLNELNKILYKKVKIEWESLQFIQDMFCEASWWDKKSDFKVYWWSIQLKKSKKDEIDWWRYQTEIAKPLLIPFAQKMMKDQSKTVIVEDDTSSHIAKKNKQIFMNAEVIQMLWSGNSSDLNAIEPAWFHLKRDTTKRKALTSRPEAARAWMQGWTEMEQTRIDAWIDRIYNRVQWVYDHNGNNEYDSLKKQRKNAWECNWTRRSLLMLDDAKSC